MRGVSLTGRAFQPDASAAALDKSSAIPRMGDIFVANGPPPSANIKNMWLIPLICKDVTPAWVECMDYPPCLQR